MEVDYMNDSPRKSTMAFKRLYKDFCLIFNCDSEQKLVECIDMGVKRACRKEIKAGPKEGAWECRDCEKDSGCIICNECYEKSKEKHKDHEVKYSNDIVGCCDCGDPDSWDPSGFCSVHTGIITSEDEINSYIDSTFNKETYLKIRKCFDEIFYFFANCISLYSEERQSGHIDSISEVLNFLNLISSKNIALLHIIVPYFENNFPIKTRHTCVSMKCYPKQIQNLESNEYHTCTCNTLENLIRVWDKKFDSKIKFPEKFFIFLNSYKFKYLFALCYVSLYDIIIINQSDHLKYFAPQIISIEEFGVFLVSNEETVDTFFNKFFYLVNLYLNCDDDEEDEKTSNRYQLLLYLVFEFFMDVNYLIKPKPAKILSKNVKIMKILIDTMALFQNRIKFKPGTIFQKEGFQEDFVQIELHMLYLFSLLVTNFDYSIVENADEILFHLFDKLRLKSHFPLDDDEYTFHIPLNRAMAIYLSRYTLYEIVDKNIDIVLAVKTILLKYYNYIIKDKYWIRDNENGNTSISNSEIQYKFEDMLLDQIKATLKFFGFINSVTCKYWVHYGENMLYYHIHYWSYDQFYLCDFTLLKLFLSQENISEIINIHVLMKLCDVNNSYYTFINSLINNDKFLETFDLGLFEKNLEIFIKLFRNNSHMMDLLAVSYQKLKDSKVDDKLLLNLISQETTNFKNFIEERLVHIILCRGNSIYLAEINKVLPFYIKFINESMLNEILNELCDKINNKNKSDLYKVKQGYLSKWDIFYIIDPKNQEDAEKYIIDFKINDISLLNTPSFAGLNIIKKLTESLENNFFNLDSNIDFIIKLTYFLLDSKPKSESLNNRLILVLMKFIDLFLNIGTKYKNYEEKMNNKILIDSLIKIKSTDIQLQIYCKHLLGRIQDLSFYHLYRSPVSRMNASAENNSRKQELKEISGSLVRTNTIDLNYFGKLDSIDDKSKDNSSLNLYRNESYSLKTLNSVDITTSSKKIPMLRLQEDQEKIECVICKLNINTKDFFKMPFGRVGMFSTNSFIYHSKLQTIKTEYEKIVFNCKNKDSFSLNNDTNDNQNILNENELQFLREFMITYKKTKPELVRTLRFISCDHFIHFSCYNTSLEKYLIKRSDDNTKFLFSCPKCKAISNLLIPHIDYITLKTEGSTSRIFQGFTFERLFKEISYHNILEIEELNCFKNNEEFRCEIDENIIIPISEYIESLLSLQGKGLFYLNDVPNSKINPKKYYEVIKNHFLISFNLIDILKNDDYYKVLLLMRDYVLSLKVLIRSNCLDNQILWNSFLQIQVYWNTEFVSDDNIIDNIETDRISQLFLEQLFLLLVLFEETELNYINLIFKHFLPLILIQYFVFHLFKKFVFKLNLEDFKKHFLKENFLKVLASPEESHSLKTFLNFYLRKALLIKYFFKNKRVQENWEDVDEEFDFYCRELELELLNITLNDDNILNMLESKEDFYPSFWTLKEDIKDITIFLFDTYFCRKIITYNAKNKIGKKGSHTEIMNPSLLLMTNNLNYEFVTIPKTLLELSIKYSNLICNNCNSNPIFAILCLNCGQKICFNDSCCKNYGKKKDLYEYIWHNKICGYGDGIYLHLYSGEITMSIMENFISTKLNIYLNENNEGIKGAISNEYILQNDQFHLILKQFKNFSYRNYFKVGGNKMN